MSFNYHDDRFFDTDKNGVLKIPFVMWLGLVIQTRHWILLLLTIATFAVGASTPAVITNHEVGIWMATAQLPSVLVLTAAVFRVPTGTSWIRLVWANGYKLMITTALLNLLFVTWWLMTTPTWNRWPELYFASTALLDLVISYWASSQALPRQVFSEFPIDSSV